VLIQSRVDDTVLRQLMKTENAMQLAEKARQSSILSSKNIEKKQHESVDAHSSTATAKITPYKNQKPDNLVAIEISTTKSQIESPPYTKPQISSSTLMQIQSKITISKHRHLRKIFSFWLSETNKTKTTIHTLTALASYKSQSRVFVYWRRRHVAAKREQYALALIQEQKMDRENVIRALRFQRFTLISRAFSALVIGTRELKAEREMQRVHERRAGAMKGFLDKLQERFDQGNDIGQDEVKIPLKEVKAVRKNIESKPSSTLETRVDNIDEIAQSHIPKKIREKVILPLLNSMYPLLTCRHGTKNQGKN
jgi:hypothetical protein